MEQKRTARVFIGLGSNVGDRQASLEAALSKLTRIPETYLVKTSHFYETDPVGDVPQEAFLNAVCELASRLLPLPFLRVLQAIEMSQGRNRSQETRGGPRTLDLDLLFWGDLFRAEEGLEIPHPRLHERAFVLVPLMEIAPDFVHPRLKKTIQQMAASVPAVGVTRLP